MFAREWNGKKSISRVSFQCYDSPHWSHREQASTLPGIWNNAHGLWPFPPHVTCMRANNQEFLFCWCSPGVAVEIPGWKFNTYFVPVEVGRDWKHSLWDNRLSQTPETTPCCSQTWMSQQGVTQQLLQRCRDKEGLGFGFITWMKRTSALEWSVTQRQYCSGTMTHFKNDIYQHHMVGNKTNGNFTTLIDTNQRDEVTYVLSNLLFI